MSVGRICTRDVRLADADESVAQAARRMSQRSVGTLLVLNDAKHPIGLLTDRDLVLRVLASGRDPQTTRVREVMTANLKVVRQDAAIENALGLMRAASVRRLPVSMMPGN
jgi:CBS domain-containing protein